MYIHTYSCVVVLCRYLHKKKIIFLKELIPIFSLYTGHSRNIRLKSVTLKALLVLWPKVFQKSQKVAQNCQSGSKKVFKRFFFSNFMPNFFIFVSFFKNYKKISKWAKGRAGDCAYY